MCYIYDFLSLHSFIGKIKYVCFLFITEHCHCKNNVYFFTVYGLVGLVNCKDEECILKKKVGWLSIIIIIIIIIIMLIIK